MNQDKERKIKALLVRKARIEKKLAAVKKIFKEEKENEDAWPGHAGTRFQDAEIQQQVLENHLIQINRELTGLKRSEAGLH